MTLLFLKQQAGRWAVAMAVLMTLSGASAAAQSPSVDSTKKGNPMDMVRLRDIDPSILIDIKWVTKDNLLKEAVYQDNHCYLRRETAERLARVQKALKEKGLGLKVWEGFRPMWMQQHLWDKVRNPNLVSDPSQGRRTHIRGIAVDVTLVDKNGKELPMPTKYCEFDKRIQMRHGYARLPDDVIKNRETLKNAMLAAGFELYKHEWWHYNLPNYLDFPIVTKTGYVVKKTDKATADEQP